MYGASPRMNCVFIYEDGTVGLRDLPAWAAKLPTWRVPKRRPFTFKGEAPADITSQTFDVEEFTRKGRMYDKRPIFCAPGWDVKEVGSNILGTPRDGAIDLDAANLAQVRAFMFHEFSTARELDRQMSRETNLPWFPPGVVEHRLRMLVFYHI